MHVLLDEPGDLIWIFGLFLTDFAIMPRGVLDAADVPWILGRHPIYGGDLERKSAMAKRVSLDIRRVANLALPFWAVLW